MTGNDGLITHVTGEGIVNKHFRAPLLGCINDLGAAVDFVNTHDDIGN